MRFCTPDFHSVSRKYTGTVSHRLRCILHSGERRGAVLPQAETAFSGLCDDDNGGENGPAIIMAAFPVQWDRSPQQSILK